MRPHSSVLCATFCLAALSAGCGGGGGDGPTAPAANLALVLDFGAIEVIEDCDGIEGDGDFDLQVLVILESRVDEVFHEILNLGPGGKSRVIGRRAYELKPIDGRQIRVTFKASELDKSIIGEEYNDDRLDEASGPFTHFHRDGEWLDLGPQSITLGSAGCLVKLSWTAKLP